MEITGGCLCRAVRYSLSPQRPSVTRTFWCSVCQYIGAAALREPCFPRRS